ncbi:MAG: MgtC/SapB family protein [Paracoccaceae bacterium]|nr:MgtC/SapB family protein [Paracoccaceae bacterium]
MTPLLFHLGLAVAIGLLVGLERGWREREAIGGSRTAGIRTYAITGLLGGVLMAVVPPPAMPWPFIAGLIVFGLLFGVFALREARSDKTFSVTGTVAALAVYALGGLAVAGQVTAAAALGTALAALLTGREVLHEGLRRITWAELRSAVTLAVMTAVVLPVLPDRAVDPWGGVNPHQVWVFTVLTAAISFAGYILTRVLGPSRGLVLGSLAGGLVSSTAVTLAMARLSAGGGPVRLHAGCAALAAMVSVLRALVIVLVVAPAVLPGILPALGAGALVFGAGGAVLVVGARTEGAAPEGPRNPFDLGPLLAFAGFYALVSLLTAALASELDRGALLASTSLAGVLDVDVAVLGALRLLGDGAGAVVAGVGLAILGGLAANALGRLVLAATAGGARFLIPYGAITAMAICAGGAVALRLGLI